MPQININGVPPGTPPSQGGTFTGSVSDNPNRAAAFEAARRATQRPEAQQAITDYDRALKQQAQQVNQSAQADARKRRQEEALFRRQEQDQQRRQREQDRVVREEARMRQSQLREEARTQREAARRREQDDRAQIALERRQAAEAERRVRQEALIGRHYSSLQSRASAVQSPATYRAIQRAAGNLDARVGDFQRRWGASPFGVGPGAIGGLLGGMGSFENTYATQNIARLGNMGGRAADSRDYRELVRIEHELKRIERVNEKQLSATSTATREQKVNAQRNLEAIREARARIAVGRSGSSRAMNAAGNLIGGASLLATNPYVDMAMAAAAFTVGLPFTTAKTMDMVMGLSKPWTDFRQQSAALGRAGGFSSINLQNRVFNRGPASQLQKALGMTPQDTVALLGQYGIASLNPEQAISTANEIRMASYQPLMGLSDVELARGLKTGRTLGVTGGGLSYRTGGYTTANGAYAGTTVSTDSDRYFEKLRKVMATATREGLDHSDVAAGFNNLLMIGARSGAVSVNAGAIANFQGTLMSSGLPGMRSGEGIAAALTGMNNAIGQTGVGGAPVQNMMWMTYFNRNGGMPKSAGELAKFLGWSDDELKAQMDNPTTAAMIQNYLHAAQSGNSAFAMSYLQPFLENRPDLSVKAFNGSAYGGAGQLIRPMIAGVATGLGYQGYTALQSGRGPAAAPGKIEMPTGPVADALSNAAATSGLPLWMVEGLGYSESSFNPAATNGSHVGLFQLGKEVRSDYGVSPSQAYDPQTNARVGALYFKKMLDSFPKDDPDRLRHALIRYKGGGKVEDIMAGRYQPEVGAEAQRALGLMFSYSNVPQSVNAARANQGQADLMAGHYAFSTLGQAVGGTPGDLALTAAGGIDQAAVVTVKALSSIETAITGFTQSLLQNAQRLQFTNGGGSSAAPLTVHLSPASSSLSPSRP